MTYFFIGRGSKSFSSFLLVAAFCLLTVCGQATIYTTGQITNDINTIQWDWVNNTPNGNSYILVGYDSSGTMTMSGNSTALNFFVLSVAGGDNSTGTFTMRDGASVIHPSYENHHVYIANGIDSEGTMTLTGASTTMDLSKNLYIGMKDGSFGELIVKDGAVFKSGYLQYFAFSAGSYSKVTVDGVGSQMRTGDSTYVGRNGTGEAVIKNGGYVYTKNYIYLGASNDSQGTVEVTGDGSLWEALGGFKIGNGGSSTDPIPAIGALKMARGGKIKAASVTVGYSSYHAVGTLDFIIGNTGAGAINCGWVETSTLQLYLAYLEMHVDPGINLTVGTQYTLVDYSSIGTGRFVGISEGDIYTSPEGYHFRINYATDLGGGDLAITATVTELPPCVVDDVDLFLLYSHWLESGCDSPDWCGGADIDGSTVVNLGDFAEIALFWLDSCPVDWPWQ